MSCERWNVVTFDVDPPGRGGLDVLKQMRTEHSSVRQWLVDCRVGSRSVRLTSIIATLFFLDEHRRGPSNVHRREHPSTVECIGYLGLSDSGNLRVGPVVLRACCPLNYTTVSGSVYLVQRTRLELGA